MLRANYQKKVSMVFGIAIVFFFSISTSLYLKAKLFSGSEISPKSEAENIVRKCSSIENRIQCYVGEFTSLTTNSQSPKDVFPVLESVHVLDPLSQDCHFIAHVIGATAVKKNISKWGDTVSSCPVDCNYGCLHGALQEYISETAGPINFRALLKDVCDNTRPASCPHIVGHLLLMAETNHDIKKSLRICREISTDPVQDFWCSTGVFMEEQMPFLEVSLGLLDRSARDWPEHLLESEAFCESFDDNYGRACWLEFAHVIMKAVANPRQQFEFCNRADSSPERRSCILQLLWIAVTYDQKLPGSKELAALCKLLPVNSPITEKECQAPAFGI